MRRFLLVGLTGGIATGKSTVTGLLASPSVRVVDADALAREVVEPGTPAYKQIVAEFGQEVLQADGRLDRGRLGEIVFRPAKRKRLGSRTRRSGLGSRRSWRTWSGPASTASSSGTLRCSWREEATRTWTGWWS
jgi:hypothetical protein